MGRRNDLTGGMETKGKVSFRLEQTSEAFPVALDTGHQSVTHEEKWSINDLHVVFDFYTDNPQKLRPQSMLEDGAEPESGEENAIYTEPYWASIRAFQDNELFLEGMLLKSLDKDGEYTLL